MAIKYNQFFFIYLQFFLTDNSVNEIYFFNYTKLYFYRLRTTQKNIFLLRKMEKKI